MNVTINDIAKICNVSKSTVSRYLNGGSVSKATAEKISKVIEKTGYESNLFASSLKRKKTGMIGVMFKGIQAVSVGNILTEIDYGLKEKNYFPLIIIENNDNLLKKESENIAALAKQGVDGIIIGTDKITTDHLKAISKIDIPVVLVGQENEYIHYRKVDNFKAGQMVGEYVEKMGHKKVVFLGLGNEDMEVGFARQAGFEDHFRRNGKELDLTFIQTGYTFESAFEKAEKVMEADPTMIVCSTDRIAMGIMQYMNEHRISIPDRFSVIGFGNYDFSKVVYPSLTTIDFDYSTLSKLVVQDIISLINDGEIDNESDIKMELVERNSVKKL